MSLRDELIQVAAVAVAMVEDLDEGASDYFGKSSVHGDLPLRGFHVLCDVAAERIRQDDTWGHPRHHTRIFWMAILAEEVGEAARALDRQRPLTDDEMTLVDKLSYAETVARRILKEAKAT